MTTLGVLTRPASIASLSPKSDTTQENSPASVLALPVGTKGVADRSKQRWMRRVAWIRSRPSIQRVASFAPKGRRRRDVDALAVLGRSLDVPDEGLDRLDLAEVEWQGTGRAIPPVLQQAAGDRRDAGIVARAPGVDALPDRIDELERLGAAGVAADVEDLVARGSPPVDQRQRRVPRLLPVPRRRVIGGVDDEGARAGHELSGKEGGKPRQRAIQTR